MTAILKVRDADVFLVVDVQNDFCPGGRLAVPRGVEVVPLINGLSRHFAHIILTQDWHPADHLSFASQHPGRKPYESIVVDYGEQTLWPDHCVQGTAGAELHSGLQLPSAELVLRKGYNRGIDSYSAFYENDRATHTGLAGYLRERGFARVFLAGLALDYCVRFSAEDARREGFEVFVIEEACRGIDLNGSVATARASFMANGVSCVRADAITPTSQVR
ncbi:MAG TPA: bifunctional nicotinamidase/pyrazinamidase [Xanthobacteraceae bacterium]|nr:bifunctional nicotinamidase/pyrazinamidase [Xanthobacteraceae bacterium]